MRGREYEHTLPNQPDLHGDIAVEHGDLCACDRDLEIHLAEALEHFGSQVLGAMDLPRMVPGSIRRGELRAVATLFWAAQIERAGLPRFTEALAEQFVHGRLMTTNSAGGRALMTYYRDRNDRHGAAERQAIYSRLFGGPGHAEPNDEFVSLWTALVQAMVPASRQPASVPTHVRAGVAAAANALMANLAPRSAGSTRFDAERILAHIRLSLRLLRDREVRFLLGGASPFEIIRWHSPHLLGESIEPGPWIARARAGAELLRWLADHLPELRAGTVAMAPGDPVLSSIYLLGAQP